MEGERVLLNLLDKIFMCSIIALKGVPVGCFSEGDFHPEDPGLPKVDGSSAT